jgi:hypothetical protein
VGNKNGAPSVISRIEMVKKADVNLRNLSCSEKEVIKKDVSLTVRHPFYW